MCVFCVLGLAVVLLPATSTRTKWQEDSLRLDNALSGVKLTGIIFYLDTIFSSICPRVIVIIIIIIIIGAGLAQAV
jgi:hypothetical protein